MARGCHHYTMNSRHKLLFWSNTGHRLTIVLSIGHSLTLSQTMDNNTETNINVPWQRIKIHVQNTKIIHNN